MLRFNLVRWFKRLLRSQCKTIVRKSPVRPRIESLEDRLAPAELISNGAFAGSVSPSDWPTSGNFYADSRFSNAHSSPGYAYVSNPDGTPGNNLVGDIHQQLTIPANATSAFLTYWYSITSQDTGAIAHDVLNITVQNSSGSYLGTVGVYSNLSRTSGYQQVTYDLTSFKGQTIRLDFFATTDGSLPTVFRIDDVSVIANAPVMDTIRPTASLNAANVTTGGASNYTFTVAYSDNVAIDVTSLDNFDVLVTGPNAFSQNATYIGVNLNSNGTPRVATYNFTPPGGNWDTTDDGTFTVQMHNVEVRDTSNNYVATGLIGTFTVNISSSAVTPSISSVSPSQPQATNGRQNLTINGSNFDSSSYVNLYDNGGLVHPLTAAAGRIISQNSTHITVNPDYTTNGAGTWQAEVVNGSGTISNRFSFQVVAVPTISSVSPSQPQATNGRQNLTINGTKFNGSAFVNLYDPNGTQFQLSGSRVLNRSSTQITVDPNFTSNGVGTWQAEVTNGSGTISNRFSFQVVAVPVFISGPRVLFHSPSGNLSGSVSYVDVTFDKAINGSTFTTADVVSFQSSTNSLPVNSVISQGGNTYRVNFNSQSTAGTYTMVIGPNIADTGGNLMNQDGDTTNGEAIQDRYVATFVIQAGAGSTPNYSFTSFIVNRGDAAHPDTTSDGILEIHYHLTGSVPDNLKPIVAYYWAKGDNKSDIIGGAIGTEALNKMSGDNHAIVHISALFQPPPNATRLLAVLDDTGVVTETEELDNIGTFSGLADTISGELSDALPAATRYERVRLWLYNNALTIIRVANQFNIDRDAIAGAIAWEALQNVHFLGFSSYGPGKVHNEGDAIAIEETSKYLVFLPGQSSESRNALLHTPEGAIRYIAAIMNAYAVEAAKVGYNIRSNIPILTTFYNGVEDKTGTRVTLANAAQFFKERVKDAAPLAPNKFMGRWAANNLDYLEQAFIGLNRSKLSITTASLPNWIIGGLSYNAVVQTTGGIGPKTFRLAPGNSLPEGLTLNAGTGAITGMSSAIGSVSFTISVTDLVGATSDVTYKVIAENPSSSKLKGKR